MCERRLLMFAFVALTCAGLAVATEGSKPRKKDSTKPAVKEPAKKPMPDAKEEVKRKPEPKKPESKKADKKPEPNHQEKKKSPDQEEEKKKPSAESKALEKSSPEAAVLRAIDAFASAFNSHRAEKSAAVWTNDGVYTLHHSEKPVVGHDKIQSVYAELFKRRPHVSMSVAVQSMRMTSPERTEVEATITVVDLGKAKNNVADEPQLLKFSAVFKLVNERWLLDSGVETEIESSPTITGNLASLDWLVGEWLDEGGDKHIKVHNVFRWNSKQTFMIRSFRVEEREQVVRQGTQIIGWDPVHKKIRSWIYGSEGGFAEGFWAVGNGGWQATLNGTLPDGGQAQVTQVLKRTGRNAMTSQLIGIEIDGEQQPTQPVVTMKRVVASNN